MPVQLLKQLPPVSFSANPIICELLSDDYLASNGINAENSILFLNPIVSGDTLVLNWGTNYLKFTAAAQPDDSGLQFPVGDGSENYVASIVQYFSAQYLVEQDFEVQVQTHSLLLIARKPGIAYNMAPYSNGKVSISQITSGVDKVVKPWFAHHVEVWFKQRRETEFKEIFNYNIELDEPKTGLSDIDIGLETLHNFLDTDLPAFGPMAITQCESSIGDYYVRYAQYYGDIPIVRRVYRSTLATVVLGGLSLYEATRRNIIAELCPDLNDATKNRFMRQGSVNKLVTNEQPEWLYYLNPTNNPQTVTATCTITYSDDLTFSFDFATAELQAFGKCQLPAGFNQLSIASYLPLKQPIYYTIRLKTATGFVTAPYKFVLDYNYRSWPRYFIYQNAYGAFQTVATTGKSIPGADLKKSDAQLSLPSNRVAIDGDFIEYNVSIQQKGTVNIGYDRSDVRTTLLLDDFLSSPCRFIYENGRMIPIGITSTDIKRAPDGVDVFASSFEYHYQYDDPRYTEEPGLADDDLYDLMQQAGSPVPQLTPGGSGITDDFTTVIDTGISNDGQFIDD